MTSFAAGLVSAVLMVYLMVVGILGSFILPQWKVERSPNTGICYEVVTRSTGWNLVKDSHPVDSKYCEKETP